MPTYGSRCHHPHHRFIHQSAQRYPLENSNKHDPYYQKHNVRFELLSDHYNYRHEEFSQKGDDYECVGGDSGDGPPEK